MEAAAIPAIAKCAILFFVLALFVLRFCIDDNEPPGV